VIINNQLKESEKMRKLFNLKKIPWEFRYAQDHLFGLAEAKTLGDTRIAKQTLKNLVAATKEQNYFLGTQGFSVKRTKLMRDFKAAPKNARGPIITKLNALADEWVPGRLKYDVRKDGSLKITNLQPEKTFKSRIKGYETLTKDFPKKIQNILSGWCNKGAQRVKKDEGGRIGFAGCPDGEKITNMKNAAAQLNDPIWRANNPEAARELAKRIAASGTKLAKFGRFAIGPWTLWGEPLFEAAFIAHDMLGNGTPWKEAVAKSIWAKPAISMGLLKPADQQYDEALWQVQNEEGEALMMDPYHERVRTPIKRFMDNSKKIDKLNKLYKLKQTSYIMGPKVFSQDERAAKMKKADETYNNYLESLGGAEGVTKINAQIENDREAYDDRVAALEVERKGTTEEDIFTPSGLKRAGVERAADIKQKRAEEDLMYQQYGKTRVKGTGMPGTPGEFKKQWIIDPEILESEKEVWNETKTELDKMLKQHGDEYGYGWTPYGLGYGMQQMKPGIGDKKYNKDLGYRQLLNKLYQSQADGGRAGYTNGGLTRTVAPDSEGIMSLKKK